MLDAPCPFTLKVRFAIPKISGSCPVQRALRMSRLSKVHIKAAEPLRHVADMLGTHRKAGLSTDSAVLGSSMLTGEQAISTALGFSA